MLTFDKVKGLDVNQVRNQINFLVEREKVQTEEDLYVGKKAVIRDTPDGRKLLGLVSPNREIVSYSDMMGWVLDGFNSLDVPFKLQSNELVKKSDDLFQQYLFDLPVENPDNQDISPMLILKGSHVGMPLKIDIGTFRFVCANGALVGNTIKSIRVNSNDLKDFGVERIRKEIRYGIDDMKRVSARYRQLASMDSEDFLMDFFTRENIPLALKRGMRSGLEYHGVFKQLSVKYLDKEDYNSIALKGGVLVDQDGVPHDEFVKKISAWDLYNIATEVSTHRTTNETVRTGYYKHISNVFAA